jgi:hypothetical protein
LSEENEILTQPFAEEEGFEVISQRKYNKDPGSNGFPAEFYHKFWEVTKPDMMELFVHLKIGQLPLYKLNFGMVTLLSKKEYASRIEQYKPIRLLNVSFKVFTRV